MANPETQTFQAEIRQLLNILAHSLYTERGIFLRELISNASDALNRLQFTMLTDRDVLDPDAELAIWLRVDDDAGTLTISDTGIGMTRDDMAENLGVIAHSGAQKFLEQVEAAQQEAEGPSAADIIGQFGVGFYSVFMVADKVSVVSRAHKADAQAYRWESEGGDTFTMTPADKETRGTEITVHLKDDAKEFLQPWTLREIVRRHSDYIAYPIYLVNDDPEEDDDILNQQTAIWRRSPNDLQDEDYEGFYKQLTLHFEPPLTRVHMRADAPMQFYALLFVPHTAEQTMLSARKEPGLKLYARKVLIQDYCTDLLPDYLNFVQGVVDSEDLPLNVSRESFQANRQIARLKSMLTRKLLGELSDIAGSDPERYAQIWRAFAPFFKQGIATAHEDRENLVPLLRFHSTRSGDSLTSLAEYVGRMAKKQEEIYYVIGDDLASVARSPHLDPFRRRRVEVIYLTDPMDSFMMTALTEYEGFKLRNVDDAGLDISEVGDVGDVEEESSAESMPDEALTTLQERFTAVLGDRVLEVRESKVLTGSPARLVSPEDAPDRNMQRVYRYLDRDYEIPKKIMEINPRHPMLHHLSARIQAAGDDELVNRTIEQLYENALLVDGLHPDPASMVERIQQLMEAALADD